MKKFLKIMLVPVSIILLISAYFIFQSFAVKSNDGDKDKTVKVWHLEEPKFILSYQDERIDIINGLKLNLSYNDKYNKIQTHK